MALMTARPWKHPKTGSYHLRQRTPLDLVERVRGQTVVLPVGEATVSVKVGPVVQACLRTKDAAEARVRHAIADGALKRFWEAQRTGPVTLSHRQIVALSGLVYAELTRLGSNEPGSPETWEHLVRLHSQAREAGKLGQWVGPSVDHILAQEGLVADQGSRERLVEAVDGALVQAATHLKRNAMGDYRPDPEAERFPAWSRPTPPDNGQGAAAPKLTVDDLFERWAAYSADKKAANTIKRYRGSFRSLAAFAKDKDIRSLTPDDLFAWAEHRRDAEEITPRAINKNDMVAVSSVFGWAASRHGRTLLNENPARGVRLEEPRRVAKRERTFRDAEIAAILSAASAVKSDDENPTLAAARRWCP